MFEKENEKKVDLTTQFHEIAKKEYQLHQLYKLGPWGMVTWFLGFLGGWIDISDVDPKITYFQENNLDIAFLSSLNSIWSEKIQNKELINALLDKGTKVRFYVREQSLPRERMNILLSGRAKEWISKYVKNGTFSCK